MSSQWLPRGHHWGLQIDHYPVPGIGQLMTSAGDKAIWHTTEGSFASAHGIFRTGHDAPHVLVDVINGQVMQYLPLDATAKALEHPAGTPETNRAGCRQIEVAAFAAHSQDWGQGVYNALGSLAVLIEHRSGIPRRNRHPFRPQGQARRLTPAGFIRAAGHLGHEHVPNQPTGHWDPGAFRWARLLAGMRHAERTFR